MYETIPANLSHLIRSMHSNCRYCAVSVLRVPSYIICRTEHKKNIEQKPIIGNKNCTHFEKNATTYFYEQAVGVSAVFRFVA